MIEILSIKGLKSDIIKHSVCIILLLVLGITPILSFESGNIINIPTFLPLDSYNYLTEGLYTWDHLYSTGHSDYRSLAHVFPERFFFVLLSSIGISFEISEKMYLVILFLFPGLSMYFFIKELLIEKQFKFIAGFFGGFLYVYNQYSLIEWNNPVPMFQWAYGTTPLLLLFFVKGLNGPDFLKSSIIFAIITLLNVGVGVNMASVIVQFFLIYLYGFWFLITTKNKQTTRKAFKFILASLIICFILNIWWLLPQLYGVFFNDMTPSSFELVDNYNTILLQLNSKTSSLLNVFTLKSFYGWYDSFDGIPYYSFASTYNSTPSLILISYLLPFFAFCSLIIAKHDKNIIYFSFIALIGIFFVKGIHTPFGEVFLWLFNNIPLFTLFRQPYDKFGMLVTLGYAITGGTTMGVVYSKLKSLTKKYKGISLIILIIFFTIFLVYLWPWFTGDMFNSHAQISIPEYYFEANQWLENENGDFRILYLPFMVGDVSANNWGFRGYTLFYHFKNKPIISSEWGVSESSTFINASYERLESNLTDDFYKLIRLLNVKWIILDNSIDWQYYGQTNPSNLGRSLKNKSNIQFSHSIGKLDFYKIDDDLFLEHIYGTNQVIFTDDINYMLNYLSEKPFDKQAVFVFENQFEESVIKLCLQNNTKPYKPKIEFEKINPTKYKIHIKSEKPFVLVFSETYNDRWLAYYEENNQIINNHFLANGYANAWCVDPEEHGIDDNFNIILYFKPQSYYYIGLILSGLTFIGCIGYLLWDRKKRTIIKLQIWVVL